jgi:hypothetical protein
MAGTARRVIRLLEKRGLENEDDPLATDDPLLATLMAASVRSRIATGPEATRKLRLLPSAIASIRLSPARVEPTQTPKPQNVVCGKGV